MAEGYEPQPLSKRQITGITLNSTYIDATGARDLWYYIVSGLAVVSLNFRVIQTIPAGTIIMSGLPKPDNPYCCVINCHSTTANRFEVGINGELYCNDENNNLAWHNGLAVYPLAN